MSHKLPPGFVYDRPVPQRWADELAQLTPKSEVHPWLQLAWLPGEPWTTDDEITGESRNEAVQRWCVYEMVPIRLWWELIQHQRRQGKHDDDIWEVFILKHLNGPHPREIGGYDIVLKRFVSDAEVTRQEWELYRAHKAVPLLFWIIQGDKGGHKRTFTPREQKEMALAKLPTEPPEPGSLPYADFDQRTLVQLAKRDRLHKSQVETLAEDVEFRRQFVAYLENQVREGLESVRLDLSGVPRSGAKEDDPTEMIEEAIDRYIQTGSTAPPPES